MHKSLPFYDKYKHPMMFAMPDPVLHMLHDIDRRAAGSVDMETPVVSTSDRDRYLISSLIEEAITSSQLEGASTTRNVAVDMLRSGRRPQDRSEQMIMNNYHAMEIIRERRKYALTPELVFELHRVVSEDTLDNPEATGRLRNAKEPIYIQDQFGNVLHRPPSSASLSKRLRLLCKFANGEIDGQTFVHPVIRAILLHFMIGYDHPFVDGNGRTARALFYWSLARSGYWLMEYISISSLLRRKPSAYIRAYLHAETDENDVTYFILHQLKVIEKAIEELYAYLERKNAEQRIAQQLLRNSRRLSGQLNNRQIALLSHALKHAPTHENYKYTVEGHKRSHRITSQTARTDLMRLAELNLLEQTKHSRAFVFYAPADLRVRIETSADG